VKTGDSVRVASRRGSEVFRVKLVEGARPGLVFVHMHDPDRLCNTITIDAVDPVSKQPEFKVCAAKVERAGRA
jgi:nitrate reductase NapA